MSPRTMITAHKTALYVYAVQTTSYLELLDAIGQSNAL